ncbi:MAG: ABC transporter ATP-binding protein [Anaerolineales bacterium]|nr:ABC transporter ATP-binding protein [Anaerolineales bacterium]
MNHISAPALELNALTKLYHNGDGSTVKAIDNLSLTIPQGRVFGLLGNEGAGKTTLVELISGRVEPTAGTISVSGHILTPGNITLADQIGLVMAGVQTLNRRLSIWENFAHRVQPETWPEEKLKQRLEMLKSELNLWELPDCPVHQLSPTQQRLVTFACAMQADPPLVIFDEPLAGLDDTTASLVKYWLAKLALSQGKTVIVATRQPELIEEIGDEVALISQGRLLTQQPVAQLLRAPQATVFEIKFKGHLPTHWRDWFDNLSLTQTEAGETILAGPVRDQAALYGILIKIRDLALPLLSVTQTGPSLTNVMRFFQPEDSIHHQGCS